MKGEEWNERNKKGDEIFSSATEGTFSTGCRGEIQESSSCIPDWLFDWWGETAAGGCERQAADPPRQRPSVPKGISHAETRWVQTPSSLSRAPCRHLSDSENLLPAHTHRSHKCTTVKFILAWRLKDHIHNQALVWSPTMGLEKQQICFQIKKEHDKIRSKRANSPKTMTTYFKKQHQRNQKRHSDLEGQSYLNTNNCFMYWWREFILQCTKKQLAASVSLFSTWKVGQQSLQLWEEEMSNACWKHEGFNFSREQKEKLVLLFVWDFGVQLEVRHHCTLCGVHIKSQLHPNLSLLGLSVTINRAGRRIRLEMD